MPATSFVWKLVGTKNFYYYNFKSKSRQLIHKKYFWASVYSYFLFMCMVKNVWKWVRDRTLLGNTRWVLTLTCLVLTSISAAEDIAHTEQPSFLKKIRYAVLEKKPKLDEALQHHKNALIKYEYQVNCRYMLSFHKQLVLEIQLFKTKLKAPQNN